MKWRKVVLSPTDLAAGKQVALKSAFTNLFHNHGGPRDAAMYQLRARPSEFFFSPGAWSIAWPLLESYQAVECDAPKESDVTPEVAHSQSPEIPFRLD